MSGRDINEERLRLLARYLGRQAVIASVETFPAPKPDRIVGHLDPSMFPEPVESVRIEVRLRRNGDLNCQYIEEWAGEQWACRWDRHDNPHTAREHFHPPPTVRSDQAYATDLPSDLNDLLRIVFSFVEKRIGDLWGADDPTYPSEYTFEGDYGLPRRDE